MKKVSVILPTYQEEQNVALAYTAIKEAFLGISPPIDYELIFVDDGSTDNTSLELRKLHEGDKQHVVVIHFLRNFGQVAALLAGLSAASGDCAVVMSVDLQDPPSLLADMAKEWLAGSEVVIATRESREDRWIEKTASKIFYGLMRKFSISNMPVGGFDYFLVDKKVLQAILSFDERNVFLQGQILWPGFKPKFISYVRKKRNFGKSHWSAGRRIKYFIDGFVGYSFFPIRLISVIGLLAFVAGILLSGLIIAQTIIFGTRAAGWSSIMVTIFILNGIQMMMIGIIGEYLWRGIAEVKKRPLYLIKTVLKQS